MPLKKLLYLRTNEIAQLIFIYVTCILSDVAYIDKSSIIIHMCKWICAYVYVYARLCAYMYVYAHACSLCLYVYTHVCKYMHMHRIYLHLIHIKIRYMKIKLTLKRPGLCGWLRPTQFKPRLDWVGSAAQVRRYCVDSAAQAFIHALAGCVPRSLQYALCGPRNSRPAHFAAHALDVLATHESPSVSQLST